MDKKLYLPVAVLAFFAVIVVAYAAIPNNTLRNNWLVVTNVNVTGDYFWRSHNITAFVEGITIRPTNEWGLVYGTTGDWFNYTTISGAVPVYINVHMHPLNETIGGEKVFPQVYDKDATHWQLALYYLNGTQCTKDCLVMYYAHIDWGNPTGLTYILPNGEEPA